MTKKTKFIKGRTINNTYLKLEEVIDEDKNFIKCQIIDTHYPVDRVNQADHSEIIKEFDNRGEAIKWLDNKENDKLCAVCKGQNYLSEENRISIKDIESDGLKSFIQNEIARYKNCMDKMGSFEEYDSEAICRKCYNDFKKEQEEAHINKFVWHDGDVEFIN